jgi:hypothetical protein
MNKARLFDYLKHQDPETLIQLLEKCYDSMRVQQIAEVFWHLNDKLFNTPLPQDGKTLLEKVQKFREDSLQGVYYAPFDINSKNYMNVPEETDQWFDKLGDFLIESTQLSQQGDHVHAVHCFNILYDLIINTDFWETIVFGDEVGMWMLTIKEKPCIEAYFTSAAAVYEPEEYVEAVSPIISYYDSQSREYKAYEKALNIANEQQKQLFMEKLG